MTKQTLRNSLLIRRRTPPATLTSLLRRVLRGRKNGEGFYGKTSCLLECFVTCYA